MNAILLTFLFVLSFSENAAAFPVQVIEAEEGDDVSLECPQNAKVSLEDSLVEWSKDDRRNLVHVYRHGRDYLNDQKEEFRGRTTLFHEGLKQGNVTLQLRSVRLSDSGTYRCYVKKLGLYRYVTLKVAQKGQNNPTQDVSSTPLPVEAATEPNDPVGEKMTTTTVLAIVLSVAAAAVVVFIFAIVGVLVKRGTSEKCQREQEAKMAPNNVEMENLNQEEGEDLDITVENIQQEV